MARLFISYARRDARDLAGRLYAALAPEHDVWLDTQQIEGGASWSREIEDSVDACDVLLALLSPGASDSPICRGEQLRALRMNKRVIPLVVTPGADRPIYLEAANYRDLSTEQSYGEQIASLRGDLADWRRIRPLETPLRHPETSPPPAIQHLVERREILAELRALVLRESTSRDIGFIIAQGLPGTGKTTLAAQLCHDERVVDAFPAGIVWVSVGRDSHDLLEPMLVVKRALRDDSPGYDSPDRARRNLQRLLASRASLIVLDDVWRYKQIEPFIVDSARSRVLVTSRPRTLAPELGALELQVPAMTEPQAVALLRGWAARDDPTFPEIATRLGHLPIALRIAGALLRRETRITQWLARLGGLAQLRTSTGAAGDRERDLFACFELSLEELASARDPSPADPRALFHSLGIFPQDVAIPDRVATRLWSALAPDGNETEWTAFLKQLDELGLIDRDGDAFTMHDLLFEFCRERLGTGQAAVHETLLRAYNPGDAPWGSIEDEGYLYAHLADHLVAARGVPAFHHLLRQENEEEKNAWYAARAARGQTRGFTADVHAAWRLSVQASERDGRMCLANEARCALICASLRSQGGNAPPPLLRAFVEKRVWTLDRASEYSRQLTDPADRAEAFVLLSELGPSELLREAEAALPSIADARQKDETAGRIACAFRAAGDSAGATRAASAIEDSRVLRETLLQVFPAEAQGDLQNAADRVLERLDVYDRAAVLANAVQQGNDSRVALVARALRALEAIDDAFGRARASGPLLPHMNDDQRRTFLEEALSELAKVNGLGATWILKSLAPWLTPEAAEQALSIVLEKDHDIIEDRRAEAVLLLRPHLTVEQQAHAVNRLLAQPLLPRALGETVAACIDLDGNSRESLLQSGLAAIEKLEAGWERSSALQQLGRKLSGAFVSEALRIASAISEDQYRYEALLVLARRCTEPATIHALLAEARRLGGDERFRSEALDRCCQLASIVLPLLSSADRRQELASIVPALDAHGSWYDSYLPLVSFLDDMEKPQERLDACLRIVLEHKTESSFELSAFCERLPPRHHDQAVRVILDHPEVGPRSRALGALAPHLGAASLRVIPERLESIGDDSVREEVGTALRDLNAVTVAPASGAGELDVPILERISMQVGTSYAEDVEWIYVLVAEKLAALGAIDAALAVTDRIGAHRYLYRRALSGVARWTRPDRIAQEIDGRLAAAAVADQAAEALRQRSGTVEVSSRESRVGWPENIEPLLRYADPVLRIAIRDRLEVTEHGRALLHRARFAAAIAEDRERVVREYLDAVGNRAFDDDLEVVETLVSFVSESQFTELVSIVERAWRESSTTNTGAIACVRAAFAIATRDPSRLPWALAHWERLDKPYRAGTACVHAADFPIRERSILAEHVLAHAHHWARDYQTVEPLCLAALVESREEVRMAILGEAVEVGNTFHSLNHVRDAHARIAACAILLLDRDRISLVRFALERGASGFRERLLRSIEGFRFAIRTLTTADDMAGIAEAIKDCGRWWN